MSWIQEMTPSNLTVTARKIGQPLPALSRLLPKMLCHTKPIAWTPSINCPQLPVYLPFLISSPPSIVDDHIHYIHERPNNPSESCRECQEVGREEVGGRQFNAFRGCLVGSIFLLHFRVFQCSLHLFSMVLFSSISRITITRTPPAAPHVQTLWYAMHQPPRRTLQL